MSIKPNGQSWVVREQVFDDPATGMTFQFEVTPDGEPRLRIFGNVPFGNREFVFNTAGVKTGSGTATRGLCRPAWMTEIEA